MTTRRGTGLAAALLSLLVAMGVSGQTKTIAERLGYPADAKLLILHADDLGVAHSVDAASFDALDSKAVSSASIMMPTPWVTEVAAYAKAHPDADLGLHLTLTSEWKTYRWGSVESADKVPSLLGPDGTFPTDTPVVARQSVPAEAEREIRAQVERAIALGIHPTHLDSHMGSLFARPELFATLAKVAHDYHLPFLAVRGMARRRAVADQRQGRPARRGGHRRHEPAARSVEGVLPRRDQEPEAWPHRDDRPPRARRRGAAGGDGRPRALRIRLAAARLRHRHEPAFKKALKDNNVTLVTWRQVQTLLTQ